MKIAVFIKKTTFHKGYGGMEVQNKLLCEGLAARGSSVIVFSPKDSLNVTDAFENGVKYVFIDCTYRYFMSKLKKNSWYTRSFELFKKIHDVDPFNIVISQSSAGIGIIDNKNVLKIKVISIAHGSTMGEFKTFYINNNSILDIPRLLFKLQYSLRQFFGRQRQFILHSDKVVAVSNAVKTQLEQETFPPENLITVINNGIASFEMTSLSAAKFSKKLVYSGQVTKDKGLRFFLEILKDLRFKDFEVDIIGDGDLMPAFKKAITESNNVVKISLLGKLTHDQTIEKLKSETGAIFVFPTNRVEGFPMVLVEAMFAGLPIVSYDLGGVSDAVKDGDTGILVPFGEKELFVKRLLELAEDPVKIDYMSKASRSYAEKNFELNTMLDKYEKIIKELADK